MRSPLASPLAGLRSGISTGAVAAYVVPAEPITAPTIETAVVDGILGSGTTSRIINIPSSVTTGDWLLIAAVHRQDGTLSSSIGTQVGSQASDFVNHEMAVWKYQVTGSDVPGTTTFTVSSTSSFTALAICVVPVTGSGGVDDEAGPGSFGPYGETLTAPSTTSTQANSVAVCFVSANANDMYTPQAGAVEIAEATLATAGLYAFSYLQETAGVVGTLTATSDNDKESNHYGCTILMQGT